MSARTSSTYGEAVQIGEILNRSQRRRSTSIVRRGSVLRDDLKGFFRAVDRRSVGLTLKAAERLENITKAPGKRNGALGYTALKILRALFGLVDYRTGRLEPSYKWIHEKTRLSISAIAAALKRLAALGFLVIARRYEATANVDGGPAVRQITNAYRIELPALAAKTLRTPPPSPLPDDEVARQEEAQADRERMILQLPAWEQPGVRADGGDLVLAEVFNRLGRSVYAAPETPPSL